MQNKRITLHLPEPSEEFPADQLYLMKVEWEG